MAKSLSVNHTDTAVAGNPTMSLTLDVVNFAADFAKLKDAQNEVILTNVTSPVGKFEKFRFTSREVTDSYKRFGVTAPVNPPKSTQIMVQLMKVETVTDSVDATFEKDLVMEGHIVLSVPQDGLVTAAAVDAFVMRLLTGLYKTGIVDSSRIQALLRGSLMPSDV